MLYTTTIRRSRYVCMIPQVSSLRFRYVKVVWSRRKTRFVRFSFLIFCLDQAGLLAMASFPASTSDTKKFRTAVLAQIYRHLIPWNSYEIWRSTQWRRWWRENDQSGGKRQESTVVGHKGHAGPIVNGAVSVWTVVCFFWTKQTFIDSKCLQNSIYYGITCRDNKLVSLCALINVYIWLKSDGQSKGKLRLAATAIFSVQRGSDFASVDSFVWGQLHVYDGQETFVLHCGFCFGYSTVGRMRK